MSWKMSWLVGTNQDLPGKRDSETSLVMNHIPQGKDVQIAMRRKADIKVANNLKHTRFMSRPRLRFKRVNGYEKHLVYAEKNKTLGIPVVVRIVKEEVETAMLIEILADGGR